MGAFIHRDWSLVERRLGRHDLGVEPDEEERRAERAWLETGSPVEFIRWRAFRERRGAAWSPLLGQRIVHLTGTEGIVVRVTRRRVRFRTDQGGFAVAPLGEVAPILGSIAIPTRRVTCSSCGRAFLLPESSGTRRSGPGGRSRWTCDVPAPFHLRVPDRRLACPGSEEFAIAQDDWRPRSAAAVSAAWLVYPRDRRDDRARTKFERK